MEGVRAGDTRGRRDACGRAAGHPRSVEPRRPQGTHAATPVDPAGPGPALVGAVAVVTRLRRVVIALWRRGRALVARRPAPPAARIAPFWKDLDPEDYAVPAGDLPVTWLRRHRHNRPRF